MMKIINPLKAIEINPETFAKIGEHLTADELEDLKQWYDKMTAAGEEFLHFVTERVFENGCSIPSYAMPWDYFEGAYIVRTVANDMKPDDWFVVVPKPGRETRF